MPARDGGPSKGLRWRRFASAWGLGIPTQRTLPGIEGGASAPFPPNSDSRYPAPSG